MAGDMLLRRSERAVRADPQDPSGPARHRARRRRLDPFATILPELLPLFRSLALQSPWSALSQLRARPELGRYALPVLHQARRATIALDERRVLQVAIKRLRSRGDAPAWIRFEGSAFLPPSVYALLGSPRIPFAATRAVLQLSGGDLEAFIRWAEAWSRDPEAVEARAENRRHWSVLNPHRNTWRLSAGYHDLLWGRPRAVRDFVQGLYAALEASALCERIYPQAFRDHIVFRLREGGRRRIIGRLHIALGLDRLGLRLVTISRRGRQRQRRAQGDEPEALPVFVAALEEAAPPSEPRSIFLKETSGLRQP